MTQTEQKLKWCGAGSSKRVRFRNIIITITVGNRLNPCILLDSQNEPLLIQT